MSQILVCHSENCKQNVTSLFVFITDLIFLNSLLDGTERDVRMRFWGKTFIPTKMIRNALCKFMIEFSFVRTFSSIYCPIKILRFCLCRSNLLFLNSLKPSLIPFHENYLLQADTNHKTYYSYYKYNGYSSPYCRKATAKIKQINKLFIFV